MSKLLFAAGSRVAWSDPAAAARKKTNGRPPAGRLPQFTMVAYTGGPMRLAGFCRPVVVDLAGAKALGKSTPIFRDHDPAKVVGHGAVVIDRRQIVARGVIGSRADHAQEIVELGASGFPWQASIGATDDGPLESIRHGETVALNGRSVLGPVLVSRSAVIHEISVVALGGDRLTSTTISANKRVIRAALQGLLSIVTRGPLKLHLQVALAEPSTHALQSVLRMGRTLPSSLQGTDRKIASFFLDSIRSAVRGRVLRKGEG